MSTVGSVLINFGAGTAGYFAGSKAVKDDAGSISSTFGGIGGSLTGLFAGIGAALSAGALVEGLKSAGEQVINLAHDADRLSVSTEELSRLRFAAKETGVDAESLSHAMLKAQVEIGKAAAEGGEAADKLGKMGFNVAALKDMNPADEFSSIADTISKINNPAQRAAAEVAIFGKSGAELKPLLEQGAAGIAKMGEESDKLHNTISSVDAATMLRAGIAVDQVQTAVSGVAQHIAIELAPYVEDIAKRFLAWAEDGDKAGKLITGALKGVSYAAAFVVDIFKLAKGTLEVFGATGMGVAAIVAGAFDAIATAGAWVINHIFGTKIDTSGIDNAVADLAKKANDLAGKASKDYGDVFSGRTATKVFEYFDAVQDKAIETSKIATDAHKTFYGTDEKSGQSDADLKKATEALAKLQQQIDTFGMSEGAKRYQEFLEGNPHADNTQKKQAQALSDRLDHLKEEADITTKLTDLQKEARQAGMDSSQKQIDDLSHMKGILPEQIEQAKKYQAQIESTNKAKEEAKRLDEEAKKVKEDALTPLQREQEELAKLQKLYETHRITAEQFASAAAKKEAELHGESHNTQTAATRGSEAAFKLMNEINKRANGGDKKEQIAQAQLAAQKDANKFLGTMAKNTKPRPVAPDMIPIA